MLRPVGTVVSPRPEQSAPPSSSQRHSGEHVAGVDCPSPAAAAAQPHSPSMSIRVASNAIILLLSTQKPLEGNAWCLFRQQTEMLIAP